MMYENLNGLQSTLSNKSEKLEKARRVIDDLQANKVCYNEHQQNLWHKSNRNGFRQMFNGGKTELRAIASHNKNKEAGKFQEGGTAMVVYKDLIQQYNPAESGRDDLGLGRWTHMKFKGDDNISTRVICVYSPCANKKKDSGTVYQQHCWHLINTLKKDTCPQAQFCEDLLRQLKQWHKDGEHLILCMDANKNIYRGKLGQQLTELHGLGMKEVVQDFTTKQLGAPYFQGRKPIDTIWATSNVTVANACVMPVGYGVRDHRLIVVDFSTATLVGTGLQKIVQPALHHLNTKIEGCALQYNKVLTKNILRHRLLEQMV
jgi:exonuclease III